MKRIIQKAKETYQRYGLDDLDLLAWKLGAKVEEVLMAENLKEVYFPKLSTIVIKPNLDPRERSYLIAHALGHHLFHQASSKKGYIYLYEEGLFGSLELGRMEISKKEREADIFAAYLLIPEEKLKSRLKEDWVSESPDLPLELAEEFQVPEELMRKRLEFEELQRYSLGFSV